MFKLRWIGQNGFMITLGDKTVCIDPYLSNSVLNVDGFNRLIPPPISPSELNVDIIATTHDHVDHLDEETLKYTNFNKTFYLGPTSCVEHFKLLGIKEEKIIQLNAGNSIRLNDAVITAVYADHYKDSIGIIVNYNDITIYFVGDSLFNKRLFEVKSFNIDIIVTCINGKLGNMNYIEAAKLSKEINPKVGIPCHYGMFAENTEDPSNYKEELKNSGIKYFELELNKIYNVRDIIS